MYDMKALYEAYSVEEAVKLRLEHPEAQIIAGGSDVLVQMREGKRAGKELISIYGLDELRGLLRACDGGGDGLGRFIQTVDGQMLVFGCASSGGAEDHRQTRLAEQGVHGLAAVGIGNGNDII